MTQGISVKPTWTRLDAPHLEENITDFFSYFEERVKYTTVSWYALSLEIIFLEGRSFPGAAVMKSVYPAMDGYHAPT